MYRGRTSKIVNGRAWTRRDTSLITDMTKEEQVKVMAWIHGYMKIFCHEKLLSLITAVMASNICLNMILSFT